MSFKDFNNPMDCGFLSITPKRHKIFSSNFVTYPEYIGDAFKPKLEG